MLWIGWFSMLLWPCSEPLKFGQDMVFWGHIYCSSLIWAFTCSSAATVQTQQFNPPPHEFSHTTSCHFKGAFKWPKFSLTISAHRYYTETLHEFNILTSFLIWIWVQLSESFSELKIGWFLWHLDQKFVLPLWRKFLRNGNLWMIWHWHYKCYPWMDSTG